VSKRKEIERATIKSFFGKVVAACPDPHVERWFLADPDSFRTVVGYRPVIGRKKCTRGYYKDLLANAIRQGGHPAPLGGVEFAREIVEMMDLYRASTKDRALKAFLDDLRAALHRFS